MVFDFLPFVTRISQEREWVMSFDKLTIAFLLATTMFFGGTPSMRSARRPKNTRMSRNELKPS